MLDIEAGHLIEMGIGQLFEMVAVLLLDISIVVSRHFGKGHFGNGRFGN